ncbi:MAG: MmgE/PrpD family protein [Promethearchaeota archaeon]
MPTIIERFAEFASNTEFEDIPERVIDKVKLQIITSLTASKFSEWHPEALKIYKAEKNRATPNKTSTVIALNEQLSAEEAAVVNASYAMSLDFDDYMLMGHMNYSSVLTSLAFLEEKKGTLKDLLVTATVSNEVMGRLSLSCFFGPLNGQMWSYIHNLGAATAVGKVKNFNTKQMKNAMALALYQPNFCLVPGFWNEGSKLLTSATPLRAGIQAALYAEQGLEGPKNIIEGELGFFHFFSFHPIKEFTGDLGNAWLSDTLSYKRYPGTSYIGGPVDSALNALRKLGIKIIEDVDLIEKVIIDTTILSYSIEEIAKKQDYSKLNSICINFSVTYSVAYALLRGDLRPSYFKQEEIDEWEESIHKLAKKVKVKLDLGMTARTLLTFPQVINLAKRMSKEERGDMLKHLSNMRTTERTFKNKIKLIKQAIKSPDMRQLIKKLIKKDKTPINLVSIDLPNYPMLQSARGTIIFKDGRKSITEVPILRGGAGIDLELRKKWVQKRFKMAFNRDPKTIFTLLDKVDTSIEEFMQLLK